MSARSAYVMLGMEPRCCASPQQSFLKRKKKLQTSSSILVNFLSQINIIPTSNLILPQFGAEDNTERGETDSR